jgi:hypothetical protein
MKFQEVFDAYIIDIDYQVEGSMIAHRGKIKKYLQRIGNIEIEDAFAEEKLKHFIFNGELSPSTAKSALLNFHQFYFQKIKKQTIVPQFPVQDERLKVKDKNGGDSKVEPVILTKEQIQRLFDDEYYTPLNDEKAALTMKACIALCLASGYDTGDFSPSNRTQTMTLVDCEIQDDYVVVPNYATQSTVPKIIIRGECAEHIKRYYEIRKASNVNSNNFICKIWDAYRSVNYSDEIYQNQRKRYEPHDVLNYVLKYISVKFGLDETLYATHLRTNMVYHSLINSSGTSLHQIIEVFGFPTHVQYAFERYCEETNNTSYFGFNDFFDNALSGEIGQNDSSFGEAEDDYDSIEARLRKYLIERRERDTDKVKTLKDKYANICQVCNTPVTLLQQLSYSEVHHIQPFGKPHNGIDDSPNMLVLCPNHHTLFDLGIIGLNPMNPKMIVHIDANNLLHNTELKLWQHELSSVCVRYHYENIFTPLKLRLSL